MQAHTGTTIPTSGTDMRTNMQRFASLGLDVELTEMDVWTSPTPGTTADKLAAQAAVYRTYATTCRQVPACKRLTTWGVYDGLTWLGSSEMPLLFDLSYHGKPAFSAVGQAFAATP
jgi:endo-1,4-beta-xylanase